MAILKHETIESNSGFTKEIEESALTMIFDNLQKGQYHYPVKSTIREIACNGLDSIKERDAVREILEGKKTEEDYFIRRDEALYKDSNYDPTYYNLNWLSKEKNVIITYHSLGTTEGQDFLSIKDYGVGLGGKRLEGYMRLGYSTKRNSKLNLGKFGIGAKAPLSTNIESFRLITTYNGARFIFDIYSHKVDSAIPKLNMSTGKVNKSYKFANDYIAYYEKTEDKNSTEIIVKTKKHHKSQYLDAVKSQLLYLKGIKLFVNSDGYNSEQSVSSDILYEDDKIILANNYQYSKPHIVIDGVTYGYIDFLELELENKVGNVGIKVSPEEVNVNPSREYVIWNEQTRDTVVTRFNEVVGIASKFVEKELSEANFLKWIQKCTRTLAHTDRNSILGRLSQLVDKSQIKPAFLGDDTIKYNSIAKFFRGFRIRVIHKSWDRKKGQERVSRIEATSWSDIDFDYFYLQNEKTAHTKDLYLNWLANDNNNSYSKIATFVLEPLEAPPVDPKFTKKLRKQYIDYQNSILKQLKKSKVNVYEDVEIPEDWKAKAEKMVEAEEKGDSYDGPKLTPAERRKQNNATVFKTPRFTNSWSGSEVTLTIKEWTLKAVSTVDDNPDIERLVYATLEDRELVEFLYEFIRSHPIRHKIKIISISKDNIKHYVNLKKSIYIKDVFKKIDVKNKLITVDKLLTTYNTARLIGKGIQGLLFMSNYDSIDIDKSAEYKEVHDYYKENKYVSTQDVSNDIDNFLDKLVEFQLFVAEVAGNKKMVAKKSKELFDTPDFDNSLVIDMDIYEKYKALLSYAEPINELLNAVNPLRGDSRDISEGLEREIKGYIAYKMDLE